MGTRGPKKGEGGRPSVYKDEYADRAKELCSRGATVGELAAEFEVSTQTIYNWIAKYPNFLDALTRPRAIADEKVERSLFERANGYTYRAVKIFLPKDSRVPVIVPYDEHVPPDPTAMIFWLKNRKPKEWRNNPETEGGGGSEPVITIKGGLPKEDREVDPTPPSEKKIVE